MSLCVLECGNLLALGPDGNCFGEGKEKMEKSQKGRKDKSSHWHRIIIIKLYGTFPRKGVKYGLKKNQVRNTEMPSEILTVFDVIHVIKNDK